MNDRQLAFKILNKIERDKAYSNLTLDAALRDDKGGSSVSSSFVTALVYGVTERKLTLDYVLSSFLKQPLKKLKPEVLTILRMGVLQLKFMDKIPASAAVNESVKLTKQNKCAFASGLVNSVLRKVNDAEITYPNTDDIKYNLSIKYSCPIEIVSHFINDYGIENTKGILSSSLGARNSSARVNTLKTDTDSLIDILSAEEVIAEPSKDIDDYIIFNKIGAVEKLKAFNSGFFHIQDTACGKAVNALELKPGMVLIDMCSAPGGKAFTAAEIMQNKGEIYAFDLYPQRVKLISDGASRLNIDIIKTRACDMSVFLPEFENFADCVLCDVPCSGFGIIGKKPEIRYKDISSIDNLLPVQYNILVNAAKYVKKGGRLVYSTCTLNRKENDNICDRFLSENSDYKKLGDYITLMPHKTEGDGFFFAVFGRE